MRYAFCVKYIRVEHFKTLDDMVVENILDAHYNVDVGGNYNAVISLLAMKEGPFNEAKDENYAIDFTKALLLDSIFINPFSGGTTEELI